MSQSSLIVRKGGSSAVRRKLDSEDEIIRIPDCDIDAVADRFRLTLIGRVFHLQGRSIDALIHLLPRNRIWNVEGRVRGINLGNGRFQFDFDNETDLLSVLNKRPCHFNQWSFALERWEPFTSESFPNTIPFWISVTGVPVHFWNDTTFIEISKVLGTWITLDSKRARFQVSVNVDMPLQFERRLEFPNGDIGRVSFSYEGLFRYCYTCHMISYDESSCPQLTPEERELKRQQRAELNAQGDTSSGKARPDDRTANVKRPRSPSNGRHSPPVGRYNVSTSTHPQDEHHIEEKRQRNSISRDSRASHHHQTNAIAHRERSQRNPSRNKDVWRRLELPPRASSAYGKNIPSRAPHRETPYAKRGRKASRAGPYSKRQDNRYQETRSWRPRPPPKHTPYIDPAPVSSRAPLLEQEDPSREVPSRAISDSQRTISDQLGQLELGEISRGEHPKSPAAETEEERQRRIKGKAHITDTPTSRDREPRTKPASLTLTIREPEDVRRESPHSKAPAQATSPPRLASMAPKNLEMDLDLEFVQELDITLTKEDIARVESELLEMDAEMMDNDDLLDESPDDNAEIIDAISQLSPVLAVTDMEMQKMQENPLPLENKKASSQVQSKTVPIRDGTSKAPSSYTARGYLKKQVPKSPDQKSAKASKVSKKLSRGRNSPKKRTTMGKTTATLPSSQVPRIEVYPSAKSKKPLSLSGSVVSQKPPSKKI
ncbi:Uncharacterized protein Rs2_05935 [Raphanus sativus]|nr:Uncharacterized protein Rs2_05935 [Raphanus sativus]